MRITITILLSIFLAHAALAQKPPMIPRVSFLAPKVGVEIGIHSVWSFYPAVALDFTYVSQTVTFTNNTTLTHTHVASIASLDLQGRHYYNVYKRLKHNQDVDKFSANFLAFRIKPGLVLNPDDEYMVVRNNMLSFEAQSSYAFWSSVSWGLQRNIGRYGFVSFMLGPGMAYDTYDKEMQFNFLGGTALELGVKF